MFNVEKEVPSLELCKKLKELGYPQGGGGFYWYRLVEYNLKTKEKKIEYRLVFLKKFNKEDIKYEEEKGNEYIKAPTVRELGGWLPIEITKPNYDETSGNRLIFYHIRFSRHDNGQWVFWYQNYYDDTWENFYAIGETEANARAKMLIWLVENRLINFYENAL